MNPLGIDVPGVGRLTVASSIRNGQGLGFGKQRIFGQWAFVLLVGGRGVYRDALGADLEVLPGDWILVFPEIAHYYGPAKGETWSEFYLCFEGLLFDQWRESQILSPKRPMGRMGGAAEAWAEFSGVLSEVTEQPSSSEALTRWLMFLLKTCGGKGAWAGEVVEPRLRKVCRLIDEHSLNADPGWDEICRETGIGYENLRKLFRQHLKTSPGRYREQRRIEKAILLVRTQRYPAKKIAEILGYHDEAHFSRAFRQGTGESFTQYKRKFLS